jgi:hypothetical protein
MLTDLQETTADASSLSRIMSPRRRKNLPVGSLISSSAEALTIRDNTASPAKAELDVCVSRGHQRRM